ncbi:MAG TPA: 6,7-dimethyl-8-ribityllumazine synthase [Polyangiaceae bacterium]|nr:6,7-dimethyl-8-ribityllumazine synthase [Polyangiaceae bacterium]
MKKTSARLAILAAEFNAPLIDAMLRSALDEAARAGASVERTERVPGCYEVPLAAKRLVSRDDVHAIVVLGYIEKGETLHGVVMGHVVHSALMDLSLAHDKPIGLGIIGPGATAEQAEQRKDGYARSAVKAALASLHPRP